MSDTAQTITLPRLEGESSRAYQARVEYILAGPQRDLRTLAQKLNKSLTIVGRWSSQYGWKELAAQHDQTVYTLAAQESADRYRADLEAHRKKASDSAKNLLALANGLTRIYADALQQPQQIRGADGKTYTLHKLTVDTNTLTVIGKAMIASLDLEAHSLGISNLMESLGAREDES